MLELDLIRIEDDVLVDIEEEVLVVLELALPFVEAHEAVAEDDDGGDAVGADLVNGFLRPGEDCICVEFDHAGLVDETVHCDKVFVAVLGKEDREFMVNLQGAVAVAVAICAVEPADDSLTTRMVPSVLTTGCAVEIEVHAKTVLPTVLDAAEEVAP